jgi:putative endonuclease
MAGNNRALGMKGEEFALRFLRRRGYKIIARNFSTPAGEIDIIARQGKAIVFIEVKTRSSSFFGWPEEAIDEKKRRRIHIAARIYMQRDRRCFGKHFRFDVVSVLFGEKPQALLIKDAF